MDFAQKLVHGRRGRRALAFLSTAGDSPAARFLRHKIFETSHRIEFERSDPAASFTVGAKSSAPAAPLPDESWWQSRERIAQLFADFRFDGVLDTEVLRSALVETVESAMYWQAADGQDTLYADPLLSKAMSGIAEQVASMGGYAGWETQAAASAQWMVSWRGEDSEGTWQPGMEPTNSQLKEWKTRVHQDELRHRKNLTSEISDVMSNSWWSTPPGGLYRSYSRPVGLAPLGLDCVEDGLGWKQATIQRLEIAQSKPVFEISEPDDWANLCQRYPLDVSGTMRGCWCETTGRDGQWVQPDWLSVAQDYDGVHLSLGAYLSGAGEVIPVGPTVATVVAGWNPDETFWFTDAVKPVGAAEDWEVLDYSAHEQWRRSGEDR